MKRFLLLLAAALASLTTVYASRYCQCENPTYGRIFPGIQTPCNKLGNKWCSTNCGKYSRYFNCKYCQYKPGGADPAADYAKLKSWCTSQTGYDSASQTSYKGTDVFCYSYQNKANCALCGGCSYYNTPFYKREEMSYPIDYLAMRQENSDAEDHPAPDANVTVQFASTSSGRKCGEIYDTAASDIVSQLVQNNTACQDGGTNPYGVVANCDDDTVGDSFNSACEASGGLLNDVDAEGDDVDVSAPDNADDSSTDDPTADPPADPPADSDTG